MSSGGIAGVAVVATVPVVSAEAAASLWDRQPTTKTIASSEYRAMGVG
jgi:hypothetical protein